jgi:hypothetical protein
MDWRSWKNRGTGEAEGCQAREGKKLFRLSFKWILKSYFSIIFNVPSYLSVYYYGYCKRYLTLRYVTSRVPHRSYPHVRKCVDMSKADSVLLVLGLPVSCSRVRT